MSPALPVVSGREVIRALEKAGFAPSQPAREPRQTSERAGRTVIVPLHRELARGTLGSILRQSGVSGDEFRELL